MQSQGVGGAVDQLYQALIYSSFVKKHDPGFLSAPDKARSKLRRIRIPVACRIQAIARYYITVRCIFSSSSLGRHGISLTAILSRHVVSFQLHRAHDEVTSPFSLRKRSRSAGKSECANRNGGA